jgi:hypothetical protein
MKHQNKILKYSGSFVELAKDLGCMRYDVLADFIKSLGDDLACQAKADRERGRVKLASQLEVAAKKLYEAKDKMNLAWKICEPYMKD